MEITRLTRLLGALACAVWLSSAATALASEPTFVPVNGQTVTATGGGRSVFEAKSEQKIECQKDLLSGAVTSSFLLGKVFIHYLECRVQEKPGLPVCTIKSVGAPENGLIITSELHGILGLILPSDEAGILLLPVSGKRITELAEATVTTVKCTPETLVTGSVAAVIEPTGKRQLTGKLTFPLATIKKIDLSNHLGLREPELTIFSQTSRLVLQTDSIIYGEATEVT